MCLSATLPTALIRQSMPAFSHWHRSWVTPSVDMPFGSGKKAGRAFSNGLPRHPSGLLFVRRCHHWAQHEGREGLLRFMGPDRVTHLERTESPTRARSVPDYSRMGSRQAMG